MTACSIDIIKQVRSQCGDTTMLAFSRGKDSIAAYIAIRPYFERIVPYHFYIVPNLEFVDESLAYYEKVMGCKIYNLPHPNFYRMLNAKLFQTAGNAEVLASAELPNFTYKDAAKIIAEENGLDFNKVLIANGVRADDSPMRRVAIMKHGAINNKTKFYMPVWDWNKQRLYSEIKKSGIRLPFDYMLFNRTFDGLDYRFLYPLKKQRPKDYSKILEWFPLADLEVWRYEKA